MATATLDGVVLAHSDETIIVEGNHYFPPSSVNMEFFSDSDKTTVCPWKGTASYFDVTVGGVTSPATAWYYPEPKEAADEIRGYVAFWGEVDVST